MWSWWHNNVFYRYRSGSELSIKELIYDEMYFATAAECNDPYEGKIFAKFDSDSSAWERLIQSALINTPMKRMQPILEKTINYFLSRAPLYADEILNTDVESFIRISDSKFEQQLLKSTLDRIKEYVNLYLPIEQYFISFSKSKDNTLMWSHYANNHRGFCLIFRNSDGVVRQNPLWKKGSISVVRRILPCFFGIS